MAPLPKRRHSTRRGGKRKAAIKLEIFNFGKCKNCGANTLPHKVCNKCGYYDGRQVIKIKAAKKEAKK